MCYVHYSPDEEEYYGLPGPGPRPLPRLTWAVPVDAAELGASLETFEMLLPPVHMFRLCHRTGSGPLATMPQEILDLVIEALYQSTKADIMLEWIAQFKCFQGRCRKTQHVSLEVDEIEAIWAEVYGNLQPCCTHHDKGKGLRPDDYDLDEKLEMIGNDIGDWMHEEIFEAHEAARQQWLDMTCLCRAQSAQYTDLKTFAASQKILKSHFGLDATFLHEAFSDRMVQFLPDVHGPLSAGYYTSCFLVLPTGSHENAAPRSRTQAHQNRAFLKSDSRLAFHQKIDRTSLDLSDEQTSRFARALRILDIQPSFHLTELEPSLDPSSKDGILSKISDKQLSGCPQVSTSSSTKKKLALKRYLDQKNKEVGQQQWPQFMLMAASDVVGPVGTS
ncbi:uncharacterized protein M421DRAFT_4579 [Didymella exigua CBS 183.55]|uniref:Uncharacterized protein n=1 Tax=Didymella exigua CBS 183.55 TaxID=1150837 RepID=A0A6A5RLY5_9PLEO|nr:uncharacterized protein M421DRAFT_4579 [Didymella exigua CBS 183.55]KAF1929441.1 hypothetical protein M421DRAFT_4579 [Didymella exigua CBS 183.55]